MKKIRVLHTITRMVVGGASENTMLCGQLIDKERFDVEVLSGTEVGRSGDLKDECARRRVDIKYFPNLVREISPIKDFIHLFEMVRFLRKQSYQIIHTHSSKAGIIHRIAAKIAGIPVIVHTIHGWSFNYQMSPLKRKVYVILERYTAKFTDKLISVTKFDIEKGLREKIGSEEQYINIHSSIKIEKYKNPNIPISEIKKNLGLDPKRIIIGTVSRMDEQKAPLNFMKTATILLKKHKNIQFLFIGDGPLRKKVEKYLVENEIDDSVILAGLRYDVPNMLAVMDIFILTSLWEGLPRVFSQAFAAKLPIVATKVDGAPEIIQEGVSGFMTKPGDYKDMAQKVNTLLEDENLRIKMGESGFKTIDPAFNIEYMISQIENLYKELLQNRYISC